LSNFTGPNKKAMSATELQTEIVQMIKDERDTGVLEAIRMLLYKLRQTEEEDDLTDEEVAELDAPCLVRAPALVSSPRSHHLHHQRQTLQNRRRQHLLDLE